MIAAWPDPADLRHARCVVLGCAQRPIACCYTRHGRSAYCPDHDPIRLGAVLPWQYPTRRPAAPQPAPVAPQRPDVGPQPHVRPFTPPRPPSPQDGARMPAPVTPSPALATVEF